jgi:hypothetical protein
MHNDREIGQPERFSIESLRLRYFALPCAVRGIFAARNRNHSGRPCQCHYFPSRASFLLELPMNLPRRERDRDFFWPSSVRHERSDYAEPCEDRVSDEFDWIVPGGIGEVDN